MSSKEDSKLSAIKDAELRKSLYIKMSEMVKEVDEKFINQNGQKIRERDIKRYSIYANCIKINASTPQSLKDCSMLLHENEIDYHQ